MKSAVGPGPATDGARHSLHLYTSKVDRHMIHRAFLAPLGADERAIIVSDDESEAVAKGLDLAAEVRVIRSGALKRLEAELDPAGRTRLIVDSGSIGGQTSAEVEWRERRIVEAAEVRDLRCLCTYEVRRLDGGLFGRLAALHDELKLTTSDLTLISGRFADRPPVSEDAVRRAVRDGLDAIILALLQRRAMNGSEIVGAVHLEFDVMLSPGTIYPTLHSLEERGLLTSLREGREKTYSPSEASKIEIRRLIQDHLQARRLLEGYLRRELSADAPGAERSPRNS